MTIHPWELASWIATTVGAGVASVGLIIVIVQLYLLGKQARLEALDAFYSDLDTYEARLAREHIYKASPDMLRLSYLHDDANTELRKDVENTVAALERMAYRVLTRQLPYKDAFAYYGGVMITVANSVWPYIEDQRTERKENALIHRRVYRR